MAFRPAGAGVGIDISSFMGDGPDFGGMNQQGVVEDAKNESLSFGLSSEMANAGTQAEGMIASAHAMGEVQLANTPGTTEALAGALPKLGGMFSGVMSGGGGAAAGGGGYQMGFGSDGSYGGFGGRYGGFQDPTADIARAGFNIGG